MKKILLAMIILASCKKEDPITPIPQEPKCTKIGYEGTYINISPIPFGRYAYMDTARLWQATDSNYMEFANETTRNGYPTICRAAKTCNGVLNFKSDSLSSAFKYEWKKSNDTFTVTLYASSNELIKINYKKQ